MGMNGNNSDNNNGMSNSLADCFFMLPPQQFTLLSTLVGLALLDNLDLDQQNTLGNFITSVGTTILTAAAQGQALQSSNAQNKMINRQIQSLKNQICALENQLKGR